MSIVCPFLDRCQFDVIPFSYGLPEHEFDDDFDDDDFDDDGFDDEDDMLTLSQKTAKTEFSVLVDGIGITHKQGLAPQMIRRETKSAKWHLKATTRNQKASRDPTRARQTVRRERDRQGQR